MLLFLKVVTKGREIKKSRLNNSLTNWAFQFSNVLGLIKTFEEFVLVEMKVKKQKMTKNSLSFFAWKCAYTLWWFDFVNKTWKQLYSQKGKTWERHVVNSSVHWSIPHITSICRFFLLLLSLILSTLLFPVVCTQDPEFFFFFFYLKLFLITSLQARPGWPSFHPMCAISAFWFLYKHQW